jgi:hypothetical protein
MAAEKDNTEFEKFNKVMDGLMAVPYRELQMTLEKDKRKKAKKKRAKADAASREVAAR